MEQRSRSTPSYDVSTDSCCSCGSFGVVVCWSCIIKRGGGNRSRGTLRKAVAGEMNYVKKRNNKNKNEIKLKKNITIKLEEGMTR